jgi:periplasmic protein TonB
MGYQALLFCPDDKLARVVSQVFSELDFTVELVHEPFAAVKKLMSQRYEAVVVDCENEQNASLLFKSARNSSSNQSSLAIALVEGQAGVAKAYRIGANLVLTKPINIEQAKGTLRVARGLLRKNADAAHAAVPNSGAAATPLSTAPRAASESFQPKSVEHTAVASPLNRRDVPDEAALAPMTPPSESYRSSPALSASVKVEDAAVVRPSESSKAGQDTNSAITSAGTAAAPALALEAAAQPVHPTSNSAGAHPVRDSIRITSDDEVAGSMPLFGSLGAGDAPSFSGIDDAAGASGGSKKLLIIAAAILAVAAVGYFGYGKIDKGVVAQAPQTNNVPYEPAQTTAVPVAPSVADSTSTTSTSATLPSTVLPSGTSPSTHSTSTPARATSASKATAPKTSGASALAAGKSSAATANASGIKVAGAEPAINAPEYAPVHVKSSIGANRNQKLSEEIAPPPPSTVASASDNRLNGLMASAPSSLPKPSLATIKVSQGVSQGLLIKRVQPKYPQSALAVHTQGAVQIEATINKEGNVVNPKVLHGDQVLARAAVEAVRQWRYKPYYLDGEPVEIQTEITITFKAN